MVQYQIQFHSQGQKKAWMKEHNWTSECPEIASEDTARLVFNTDLFPKFDIIKDSAFVYDAGPVVK